VLTHIWWDRSPIVERFFKNFILHRHPSISCGNFCRHSLSRFLQIKFRS
jgi:hypothetical protein